MRALILFLLIGAAEAQLPTPPPPPPVVQTQVGAETVRLVRDGIVLVTIDRRTGAIKFADGLSEVEKKQLTMIAANLARFAR